MEAHTHGVSPPVSPPPCNQNSRCWSTQETFRMWLCSVVALSYTEPLKRQTSRRRQRKEMPHMIQMQCKVRGRNVLSNTLPADSPVLIQSGFAILAIAKISAAKKRHPDIIVSLSISTPFKSSVLRNVYKEHSRGWGGGYQCVRDVERVERATFRHQLIVLIELAPPPAGCCCRGSPSRSSVHTSQRRSFPNTVQRRVIQLKRRRSQHHIT